jgi:hypothetical protein
VTGALSLAFFLGLIYRSASLYHPQRRAMLHLKNQRGNAKEKKSASKVPKQPLVDLSPLGSRPVRMLMLAVGAASFGLYTPAFYIVSSASFGEQTVSTRLRSFTFLESKNTADCRSISHLLLRVPSSPIRLNNFSRQRETFPVKRDLFCILFCTFVRIFSLSWLESQLRDRSSMRSARFVSQT